MNNLKSLKKPVSLLLLAAMLTGICLSGCGENTQSGGDTTASDESTSLAAVTETNRLDELGDRDLTGKVLKVLDANGSPNLHQNIPAEEENGESINDALVKRDRYVSERYNISIEYEQISPGEGSTAFKNSVLADDKNYDMVISVIGGSGIGSLASAGVLADLNSLEYLSLDREWWSPLIYDSCRINDIMYYTAGDIAPSIYCAPGCIYLNKKARFRIQNKR